MTKTLTIAVPSKGRLEEKSAEMFTQAGMTLKRAAPVAIPAHWSVSKGLR